MNQMRFGFRRQVPVCLLLVLFPLVHFSAAQSSGSNGEPYRIAYHLAMPQPATHLFEVKITVETPQNVDFIDFQMPRWSPGRYAIFDFAKNVQEVSAVADDGVRENPAARKAIPITRVDTQTWRVPAREQRQLTLSYRVYADDLSGTFSQLDSRHANYNGGSVFMYIVDHKQDPVTLKIDAPREWKIVNGQTTRDDQADFSFPNYDLLIDTPTEIASDWKTHEFKVGEKAFRVIVHAFGDDGGKRDDLARDVEKVVRAQIAMMGTPDFDSYTFLFHFDPSSPRGDGMEHLNSTQIIETGELADSKYYDSAVGTASHEFFHVWNVKRLRPVGLGPWDYTRPVVTRGLWISEGFTNYYGKLLLRRAGLSDNDDLLKTYSNAITSIEGWPGGRLMSAEESSLLASFLDGASHEQRTNLPNTSVSYYPKGETIALSLDLLIRGKTEGRRSLDDVMRRAYEEFYLKSANDSYYLKGRGFTLEEFERLASEVTGIDLSEFFARHVRAPVQPPYDEALGYVGLRLTRSQEGRPFDAGLTLDAREPKIVTVHPGSAADLAGLKQGDVLVAIGEKSATSSTLKETFGAFKPGERIAIKYRRARGEHKTSIMIPLAPERPTFRIEVDKSASPKAVALRDAWLNGK
jgi:predicted metalloprotease with PDZ domain